MITSITLSKAFKEYTVKSSNENSKNIIPKLSKINLLVGENNCGKSRFLRKLFSDTDYLIRISEFDIEVINRTVNRTMKKIVSFYNGRSINHIKINDKTSHHIDIDVENIKKLLNFKQADINAFHSHVTKLLTALENPNDIEVFLKNGQVISTDSSSAYGDFCLEIWTDMDKSIGHMFGSNFSKNIQHIYIPTLRGTRPIQKVDVHGMPTFDNTDSYKIRTVKDYFEGLTGINDRVFTGLNLYPEIRDLLLNNRDKREQIKNFENFLSEQFFKHQPVSLIPHIQNDVLKIGIGLEEEERLIFNNGDGIQSIITLLFPLFIRQGEDMIFHIEEPEIHLHPGMQRIFLESLLKPQFNTFQYFITTHSNHFLDLTLDMDQISIYTFKKKDHEHYEIENVNNPDDNVLELLGVRNSSVFLSNCTIWVEGVTDRLYLRKILDLYQDNILQEGRADFKYIEDIHYSFVEYGGSNITHWSFLDNLEKPDGEERINVERVCSKLFLVTDSDNAEPGAKKYDRQQLLQENLKESYYCLKAREIENILSKDTIKRYIISKEKNNDKLDFTKFYEDDHSNIPLGEFIDASVLNRKHDYKSKNSNSLANKVEFCKKVVEDMKSLTEFEKEATVLAEKLFEFIRKRNNK